MTKDIAKGKNKKAIDAEITSTVFDDFEKFEFFFVTYWKQVIYLCVAIIFGVAAVGSYMAWQKIKANNAAGVFAEAQKQVAGKDGGPDNKAMADKILMAIKQYPFEPATLSARLRLARIYIHDNSFDKAFEQYKILASSKLPEEMRWRIRLDEAYALELCGKPDQAIAKFADASADPFSTEDFRCEANFGAGRLYLQGGDKANAEKYLTKAINARATLGEMQQQESGISFWQTQAKFTLNRMNTPEQAVTPVAAAPAKTAAPVKTAPRK
ncbi:MAG: tetratricopeptide repeat protein [Victivallaceae bacterium]|jgi:hypothetical protein